MIDLPDKLFSSDEVAEILGVSLRSIYRYLEEGKIRADVKTVTGRHRFSKQNILDFLKPEGEQKAPAMPVKKIAVETQKVESVPAPARVRKLPDDWLTRFRAAQAARVAGAPSSPATPAPVVTSPTTESPKPPAYEPVDWLAKFRAARQEMNRSQLVPQPVAQPIAIPPAPVPEEPAVSPQPVVAPAEPILSQPEPAPEPPAVQPAPLQQPPTESAGEPIIQDGMGPLTAAPQPAAPDAAPDAAPAAAAPPPSQIGFFYYTSGIKGLKELAHLLNRYASAQAVQYAFTMYAGMSLFKSIRPFTILHAYVKPENKPMFESTLQLTPCERNEAHLCLISTEDPSVFETAKDMHGLKVVSLVRLKNDLIEAGEEDLARELETLQQ